MAQGSFLNLDNSLINFTLTSAAAVAIAFLLGYQPWAKNSKPAETNLGDTTALTQRASSEARENSPEEHLELAPDDLAGSGLKSWKEAESIREKLLRMAETDPLGALAFAQENLQPDFVRKNIVTAILHAWVAEEPNEAWNWAKENSPTDSARLITQIGKREPELAWEKAEEFSTDNPHFTSVSFGNAVLGTSYGGNYDIALEMLEAADIPVERERRQGKNAYIDLALAQWVRFAPEEAVKWVESLSEEEDPERALIAQHGLLATWSSTDPLPALEYAEALPAGLARNGAFSTALNRLMQLDLEASKQWIDSYGYSTEMDWSITDFVMQPQNLRDDIQGTVEYAQNISDPSMRTEAIVDIAQEWFYNDREAAESYFSNNEILTPEQLEKEVLSNVENRIYRQHNPPPVRRDGLTRITKDSP